MRGFAERILCNFASKFYVMYFTGIIIGVATFFIIGLFTRW